MDAMVSARVPVEIKKQGDRKLKEIGSSVTELVNSAYAYLLEYGELPKQESPAAAGDPQVKTLSGAEALSFREQWDKRAVLLASAYDGKNFKELLNQARGDYYARFA